MRWMKRGSDGERGASAVIVGILLVPLLGCLAIALDVGALYVERGQLQNGADAAALAIAMECAEDNVCNTPNTLAQSFSAANANDGAANVLTPSFPNNHTVVISTSTLENNGQVAIDHPFASFLGIDSTTVHATATAEWGAPSAAVVLPLAISFCELNLSNNGRLQLIRYDTNLSCKGPAGHPIPGGFGWLDQPTDDCTAWVANGIVQSDPGNDYPQSCDAVLAGLEDQVVLVPIFDGAESTKGPSKWYHVYAFAAFKITGWKFSGGNKMPTTNIDNAAPKCTGNCRGIQGYFLRYVFLDDPEITLGGGTNLGASVARLTH